MSGLHGDSPLLYFGFHFTTPTKGPREGGGVVSYGFVANSSQFKLIIGCGFGLCNKNLSEREGKKEESIVARGQLHVLVKLRSSYIVASDNVNGLASLLTNPNHCHPTPFNFI